MLDNKYQLNTEDKLSNDYSPEINEFWDKHAHVKTFESEHGGTINTVHINTGKSNAIVISQGRNESVLKYKEVAFDFSNQGYDIFLIDHRGQGASSRLGGDAHRGHVDRFQHYVDDFAFFVNSLKLEKHYQNCFLISHSMGGVISALYLQQYLHPFSATVFFSPMFEINLKGFSPFKAKVISYISDRIWRLFSPVACYAPKAVIYSPVPFEKNQLSSSPKRYASAFTTFDRVIETQLGGPTMRWVNESLYATEKAISQVKKINIPIMLIQSGADTIVTAQGQQAFFNNIKDSADNHFLHIANAKHELLLEQDQYRLPALTAALDFLNHSKKVK